MQERNIFIGILIVALIGIGIFTYKTYYGGGDAYMPEVVTPAPLEGTPATPTVPTAVSSATITYGTDGFSPKPLTVKVGTTVVFMNQSAVDVWPASAPHPTHTDYPEFDAKKPIKPGASYSFTFDRVGTWKYHSHLNPTHFGSVVVTE